MEELEIYCHHKDIAALIFIFYENRNNKDELYELCEQQNCTNSNVFLDHICAMLRDKFIRIIDGLTEFNNWLKNSQQSFVPDINNIVEKFRKTNKQDEIDTSNTDTTLKKILFDNLKALYSNIFGYAQLKMCNKHIGDANCLNNFIDVIKHRKIEEIILAFDKIEEHYDWYKTFTDKSSCKKIKKINNIKNTIKLRNIEKSVKNMDKAINDNSNNITDIINIFTDIDKNRTNTDEEIKKVNSRLDKLEANISQILELLQKS